MSLDNDHFGESALFWPLVEAALFKWRSDSIIAFRVGRTPFGRWSEGLKRTHTGQSLFSGFHMSPFLESGLCTTHLMNDAFLLLYMINFWGGLAGESSQYWYEFALVIKVLNSSSSLEFSSSIAWLVFAEKMKTWVPLTFTRGWIISLTFKELKEAKTICHN